VSFSELENDTLNQAELNEIKITAATTTPAAASNSSRRRRNSAEMPPKTRKT
jgi:hypothetical protein